LQLEVEMLLGRHPGLVPEPIGAAAVQTNDRRERVRSVLARLSVFGMHPAGCFADLREEVRCLREATWKASELRGLSLVDAEFPEAVVVGPK
jgi:hypothetical protein